MAQTPCFCAVLYFKHFLKIESAENTTKNDKMKYKIQHVPKIKYSMSSN